MAQPRWKTPTGDATTDWSTSSRETIHSGHFMVSQFEADAQDDEDNEIPMPDPDAQSMLTLLPHNSPSSSHHHHHHHHHPGDHHQTDELILPDPSHQRCSAQPHPANPIIDISLAKLFKCMNLAYSQKLTSPKWNRFKGVRLRWKDKIRLNNLIWRCWHMQFTMKRNTLVCQFASPLDVDLHSKPEAVVLEGKYWKRQFDVIKAEYQKWRKFHRTRGCGLGAADGHTILDTVSEFDALDWSPATSESNMLGGGIGGGGGGGGMDDYFWTSDTLFSTLNSTAFPFPDGREIAKAGIADFIQPSLGPLQPNLDDFMNGIPFQQLLNAHSRLAPVPEEGGDELFMKGDYGFPAIMGGGGGGGGGEEDVVVMELGGGGGGGGGGAGSQQQQQIVMQQQQVDMDSQAAVRYANKNSILNAQSLNNNCLINNNNNNNNQAKLYEGPTMCLDQSIMAQQQQQHQQQQQQQQQHMNMVASYSNAGLMSTSSLEPEASSIMVMDHPKKRLLKAGCSGIASGSSGPQIAVSAGKPFGRRIIHNYDKSQPTPHQTIIYNQVVAQHSQNQMQQQQQQQQQMQYHNRNVYTNIAMSNQTPIIQTTTNHYMNVSQNATNLGQPQMVASYQQQPQLMHQTQQSSLMSILQNKSNSVPASSSQNLLSLLAQKTERNLLAGSMDDLHDAAYKPSSSHQNLAYKPYPTKPNKQMASSGYSQLSPSHPSSSSSSSSSSQQQQQLIDHNSKEMYRSKSLPLNASLQLAQNPSMLATAYTTSPTPTTPKDGPFAVPKYQAAKPSRNRSNSLIAKLGQTAPTLHPNTPLSCATSEPVLSTLAKLLTSSGQHQQPKQIAPPPTTTPHPFQKSISAHNLSHDPNPFPVVQPPAPPPPPLKHATSSPNLTPTNKDVLLPATPLLPRIPGTGIITSPFPKSHSSAASLSITSTSTTSTTTPLDSTQRRVGHIHAEQKRRYNIKNGFDMLHSLIPQLQQNPNAKLSKAAMLQKGAEYIRQLRAERAAVNEKMEVLRKERDTLNSSINHLHSVLPANGAPVARQKSGRVNELYNEYVHFRTRESWKFWILGLIFKPLFESFNTAVSVASMEELSRTAVLWVDQHCSLMEMRPAVSNQLRYLSTTTDILSDPPSSLQDEVLKAIS